MPGSCGVTPPSLGDQTRGLRLSSKARHAVGALFLRGNYRDLLSVEARTCVNELLVVFPRRQHQLVLRSQVVQTLWLSVALLLRLLICQVDPGARLRLHCAPHRFRPFIALGSSPRKFLVFRRVTRLKLIS